MRILGLLALVACNQDPSDQLEQRIDYRVGLGETEANSGERGNVQITEVLWSGSVDENGRWNANDVFVEIRNAGARPLNLSGWHLLMTGAREQTHRIPSSPLEIGVGQHRFIAATDDGCFPEADWVIPELRFTYGEPFLLTLRDADERLIDGGGSSSAPPFAGGYDGQVSRSMEKVGLIFGGRGTEPHSWHFYTNAAVDVPNDDRMRAGCRARTGASPGRPNSPDYSGAFASGSFE